MPDYYDEFEHIDVLNYSGNDTYGHFRKNQKYRFLKAATGQDFGFDVGKWYRWLAAHKQEYYEGAKALDDYDLRDVEILAIPDDSEPTEFNRYKHNLYQRLKQDTGQDFGYDVEKWLGWLTKNKEEYRRAVRERIDNDIKNGLVRI